MIALYCAMVAPPLVWLMVGAIHGQPIEALALSIVGYPIMLMFGGPFAFVIGIPYAILQIVAIRFGLGGIWARLLLGTAVPTLAFAALINASHIYYNEMLATFALASALTVLPLRSRWLMALAS